MAKRSRRSRRGRRSTLGAAQAALGGYLETGGKQVNETVIIGDPKDLVQSRAAYIGVNQQHTLADFGQCNGEIAGDRSLSFSGQGTGD